MNLPAFGIGALAGAGAYGLYRALRSSPTKAEIARKKMSGDQLFVVQPKTLLQKTAVTAVDTLFF